MSQQHVINVAQDEGMLPSKGEAAGKAAQLPMSVPSPVYYPVGADPQWGANRPQAIRGNPSVFALICFGMTTCMLMFATTKWSEPGYTPAMFGYALIFGGLGQLIAGLFEIIRGRTFAGTAFASYGCFWIGWFVWEMLALLGDIPAGSIATTGHALWAGLWGFLTLAFFVVALKRNAALQFLFGTLTICFFCLAGGVFSPRCNQAAGYFGFAAAVAALYTALGELYEEELGWKLPGMAPLHWI